MASDLWVIIAKTKTKLRVFGTFDERDEAIEYGQRYLSMPPEWAAQQKFDYRVVRLTEPQSYVAD